MTAGTPRVPVVVPHGDYGRALGLANTVTMLRANPRTGAVRGTSVAEPPTRDSLVEEYPRLHQCYRLAGIGGLDAAPRGAAALTR
ncbi:hypothetical protein ABZX77_48555 [Streptomyces sp. NPDC004237]|uniref:hypothetical protein n=1 Tax=Streptomyces sp. NPDC004237 TaxID=3154455 RepID=UPI0033A30E0B